VLHCVAARCSTFQCVAVCCSVLQCVAVRCSVLQCVESRSDMVQGAFDFNTGKGFSVYGVASISRLLAIIGLFCRI